MNSPVCNTGIEQDKRFSTPDGVEQECLMESSTLFRVAKTCIFTPHCLRGYSNWTPCGVTTMVGCAG